jgi:hypothetical protein
MAHKGELIFDTKEKYTIIECSYTLTQRMTYNLQPAEKPRAGEIQLTTVAPSDNDMFLHQWMQNATETKDGKLVLQVVDGVSVVDRTINFKDAYCISLYEYFNMQNADQMHTRITIAASELSFGGEDNEATVVFKNNRSVNESDN